MAPGPDGGCSLLPGMTPTPPCTGPPPFRLPCPAPCVAATKAAFFVAKLKVKTLPTLVYFKEGVAIGRQIGYEGLRITTGGATISDATAAASTDFSTPSLARAMRVAGVLGTAPLIGGIDDDAEDEADEEEEGAGGPGHAALRRVIAEKGAGNPAEALAEARRRMLEEIEAADEL